jgi:hypothetical protein
VVAAIEPGGPIIDAGVGKKAREEAGRKRGN